MREVNVFGVVIEDTVNAPGVAYTLFTQGCWHPEDTPDMVLGHCRECHNPASHCKDGGKVMTTEQIIKEILDNPMHKTLVLSGGEPMNQAEALTEISKAVKEAGLKVWMYTGYTYEQLRYVDGWKEISQYIDVLVDGPFIPELKSLRLKFRGSKNQRILDVPLSLKQGKPVKYKLK